MQGAWTWTWLPEQGSGSERFTYRTLPGGHELVGEIAGTLNGNAITVRYSVEADGAWCTRSVSVEVMEPHRILELRANGSGRWNDAAGIWIPALDGCFDVDISLTPATNTLPIRRLAGALDRPEEISVAYVLAPELKLGAARQRYTRIGARRWRFVGLDGDFTADIIVDADGFVLDYPGLFRRAA